MDSPFKSSLTAISIGPGILGIERGVERVVRLTHLAYVEIEAFIIENLVAQMERGVLAPAVIWSDAKTLPCEPFRGLVDILFAGYPCQPFSTAGKRRGTEDPRHLYPYIERAIRIIRPRACFFENVRGHVTCGLPEVIASLEGLGYRVHWGIYSAEETGAAHKRERVFILAMDDTPNNRHRWSKAIGRGDNRQSSTDQQQGSEVWGESERSNSAMANTEGLSEREQNEQDCSKPREDTREIISSGGAELANSNVTRLGRLNTGGFQSETIAGSELAHSDYDGERKQSRDTEGTGSETESQEQREERNEILGERLRSESGNDCEDVGLADIFSTGLEGQQKQSARQEQQTAERGGRQSVSRPGEPQQAWEHPRVISRKVESSVGLSAHGYHFREDVLRALGNSVYADTAELAFIDLIRKHGIV